MKAQPSTVFIADPLDVLRRLDSQQFDLIFLDPPLYGSYLVDLNNPQGLPYRDFAEYLEYIVSIIFQSHRILTQNGSVLLKTNPLSPLNPRLFLDRIFGKQRFRSEIIWKYPPRKYGPKPYPYVNFETVLFYSKSDSFVYHEPMNGLPQEDIKKQFRHHDDRGPYKLWSLTDQLGRPNAVFEWKGVKPPQGKSWKFSKQRLDELDARGDIDRSGKFPKRKVYLDEMAQSPLGFVWEEAPKESPEKSTSDARLQKAIYMASDPDSKILDPFLTPISLETFLQTTRYWTGVSQFEIASRDLPKLKPHRIEEIVGVEVQKLDLVDPRPLNQAIRRLVSAESQSTNPQVISQNYGQKYAFLVGINYYRDEIRSLNFCISDVIELERTLTRLGYEVKTLHDDADDENLRPDRANIDAELSSWVKSLTAEDTLYVHFSCHGTIRDNEAMIITNDTRLQRLDTTAFRIADVINVMRSGRARKLVLSLDVCHAGIEMGRALPDREFVQNVYDHADGFALLAASTAQQEAYELPELEHGLFTYYLIQGFNGEADIDEDGRITVDDLRNYTLDQIRRWSAHNNQRQDPTYRSEGMSDLKVIESEPPQKGGFLHR